MRKISIRFGEEISDELRKKTIEGLEAAFPGVGIEDESMYHRSPSPVAVTAHLHGVNFIPISQGEGLNHAAPLSVAQEIVKHISFRDLRDLYVRDAEDASCRARLDLLQSAAA